jgi:DoxX-like family
MNWMAPFDLHSHFTWLRLAIALVWLSFGLLFKALGMVPRHRQIVGRVIGEEHADAVLWMVALTEIGLSGWMLVGRFLPACVAVQTAFIAAMNTLELRRARDLLLSPVGMVIANAGFLSLGWYVALAGP